MAKKSFKDDNPAMAFISPPPTQEAAQVPAQEVVQEPAQQRAQERAQHAEQQAAHDKAQEVTHDVAQEVAREEARKSPQFEDDRRPVRTQGRKGKKKPRINMAFEPDIYEYVRLGAEREDMSITQYVNEILYLHMKQNRR